MTNSPTNTTLSISREGSVIQSGVLALVLPARPEVIALREIPAGKAFEIHFRDIVQIRESDRLINEDTDATYRVVGVAQYNTPRAAHTEVVAEQRLGGG